MSFPRGGRQAAAEVHRLRDFALRGDVPGMASVLQGGLRVNARDEVGWSRAGAFEPSPLSLLPKVMSTVGSWTRGPLGSPVPCALEPPRGCLGVGLAPLKFLSPPPPRLPLHHHWRAGWLHCSALCSHGRSVTCCALPGAAECRLERARPGACKDFVSRQQVV